MYDRRRGSIYGLIQRREDGNAEADDRNVGNPIRIKCTHRLFRPMPRCDPPGQEERLGQGNTRTQGKYGMWREVNPAHVAEVMHYGEVQINNHTSYTCGCSLADVRL
jgi:hypothetical protein